MSGATPRKPPNAVERRLRRIAELWAEASADPALRLLCWRADLDERRMLDVFVALENGAAAMTADGFLRFGAAFETPRGYAPALLAELAAAAEASREGLGRLGLRRDWGLPPARPGEAAGRHFLRAAADLAASFPGRVERIVLVLAPARIADPAGWRRWLEHLAGEDIPAPLRVMVADPAEAPLLDGIEARAPGRALTIAPRLDMTGAMGELARAEGEDGPAKSYRIHLVVLAAAAGVKNAEAAQGAADHALRIARERGWPDQEVVVHMAMGATRLATGEHDLAIRSYRGAYRAAEQAAEVNHPAAPKLRLASGMGLGGAMLAAGRWADAARVYGMSAPFAAQAEDGMMMVEALRMASWCHAQAAEPEAAWRCGAQALEAGAALPADLRAVSTLPWVARTMLGLLEGRPDRERHGRELRGWVTTLLGEGWEARLDAPQPTP